MRQDNYDELGLLLTAADKWRAAAASAGVKLDRIETTFPDGARVFLVWSAVYGDPPLLTAATATTPAVYGDPPVVWQGWLIHTG